MDQEVAGVPEEPPVVETTVGDESTATVVAEAVAAVANVRPLDLPALGETVDPDALDSIFRGRDTRGRVVFSYAGYLVAVDADGNVAVYESRD